MSCIGVIDYGMGNLHSLAKALSRVAAEDRIDISYDPDKLAKADRLVLPGVGGAKYCMEELQRLELDAFVREVAGTKPMLGVCLGMQIMLEHSDENGGADLLGLFEGDVIKFPDPAEHDAEAPETARIKVPHMGWNQIHRTREHQLFDGVAEDAWFYFVHSYHAAPEHDEDILGITEHGVDFASVLLKDNTLAVQFHPEKSQGAGMKLLANFMHWDGQA